MEQLSNEHGGATETVSLGRRDQGDGAPIPGEVTVDECSGPDSNPRPPHKPFTVQLECDIMQIILTAASLATRTWQLGLPRAVVFDELHFAKFVSLFLRNVFFFDIHPPLGKMLLAAAGSYSGFEGNVSFDRIGSEYPANVPVVQLRLIPAVLGSLIVPLMYQIAVELGLSRWAALLAGAFVLLDNALLVQSRFMLMEGMLIFFSCLAVLSYLKFRNLAHREFSVQWWWWLCVCGLALTCTFSIKYVGFFTSVLVLFHIFKDYWNMLAETSRTEISLTKHLIARVLLVMAVPVAAYIAMFYYHLSSLTKAGPHDNIMTSAFQASLEGGLATLTKGQPLYVAYGSQITLRHTHDTVPGRPCWLHSHQTVYPIKYPDQRGSSHQQQVTCYIFKDVNNWWIVKHPDRDSLVVDEKPQSVKHGDIVQLVHGMSSRALNSHDVAAPVTPQNQEVSCYIDYNVSMPAQNLWRVDITNKEGSDDNWQTIKSQVRLIHVNTTTALKTTGKQLPDWGHHQMEVAADRVINQDATIWNVEEHRYTKSLEKDKQSLDLRQSEMIPLEPTHLSFWSKFLELQMKMIFSNQDAELEHKYSSDPTEWPFMSKNIAYWMSPFSNAQIHLLGNPVVWWCASLSVATYTALLVFYILRRQRNIYDITDAEWDNFVFQGELLVGGYLLYYVPFFLLDRTLFLHHYLPAIVFKILVLAAIIDHLHNIFHRNRIISSVVTYTAVALFTCAVYSFYLLTPFTYGNQPLSEEEIQHLTWQESWDFLVHARKA
ncbi:protein O-mannosyl-transferase 1-like [Haliotis rufescens]|uniref:protein O-mannosyl-transferase 1-like n=1 Tax=Haliotis rufescens TaxID=6454 RepID=UPI00201F75B8|nr:protein O-mannosyl-transferase 1-like [Haliotis rufescens]